MAPAERHERHQRPRGELLHLNNGRARARTWHRHVQVARARADWRPRHGRLESVGWTGHHFTGQFRYLNPTNIYAQRIQWKLLKAMCSWIYDYFMLIFCAYDHN